MTANKKMAINYDFMRFHYIFYGRLSAAALIKAKEMRINFA